MIALIIFFIALGVCGLAAIIGAIIISIKKMAYHCKHQWKTVKDFTITRGDRVVGHQYIQQCVHCGAVQDVKCYINDDD
jgi:multimeric flavodoxin WrbA